MTSRDPQEFHEWAAHLNHRAPSGRRRARWHGMVFSHGLIMDSNGWLVNDATQVIPNINSQRGGYTSSHLPRYQLINQHPNSQINLVTYEM